VTCPGGSIAGRIGHDHHEESGSRKKPMEGNDHWESPRDRVIAPQAADLLCRETLAVGRLPTLAIANAGNDIVWVMSRQSAKKGQGIFIGGRPVHLIAFPGQEPAW